MTSILFALLRFKKWFLIFFPTVLTRMVTIYKLFYCRFSPRAKPVSSSDFATWGMQSLFENTKNFSCPPRAWCVDMGVGVRAFKGPTASFLLSFQSLSTRPLMPVDSFILHDPLSPLELVHVLPAFPFPPPGALTLRQRNAFLKRWVISHPFANCLSYP